MAYEDLVPVGSALIIFATSFALGSIYSNLPYDYFTLWSFKADGVERSVAHYAAWANTPMRVHHLLHVVIALGLVGSFIKLFKPHPDAKLFEYGSLGLMMLAVMIYLTNLRIGVNSASTGQWGEVDATTGINVVAASQFMMVVALVGVLVLQGGLYYATWYEQKIQAEFLAKNPDEAPVEVQEESEVAEASGARTRSKTKVTKTKTKATKKA